MSLRVAAGASWRPRRHTSTQSTASAEAGSLGWRRRGTADVWRRVVEAVHAHGAAIFMQLQHAGGFAEARRYRSETVAPSAVAPRSSKPLPIAARADPCRDCEHPGELRPRGGARGRGRFRRRRVARHQRLPHRSIPHRLYEPAHRPATVDRPRTGFGSPVKPWMPCDAPSLPDFRSASV